MDKNKIIIIGLIIVIVALIAGIAMMLTGNGNSSGVDVAEGMQVYDFDSAFTMVVKDDAKFLKTWGDTPVGSFKTYFNKEDNYAVELSESDYFANNIDFLSSIMNDTDDYEIVEDGDFRIVKVLDKSDKVDTGSSEKFFTYKGATLKGNKLISLASNDLDSLKEMGNSIKVNGE
ncbi:hypothetical protein [Methanobrevibacter gottschalkii]|uniref:hypothetical protein n=1 Tax=Methanobrevibacter gottschalkii TaxID=190974 RepID=UPI0026F07EF3|nr:hypothetical protein [Methanobrevibacter gottschalkii]